MKSLPMLVLCAAVLVPSAARGDDKADLAAMQGDWKMSSAKRDGKPAPPEILSSKLNVMKSTFTLIIVRMGKERKDPIEIKLDSSKSPKQIDFVRKDGTPNNHGIYKLDGRKLTLCFARARDARPTTFDSKEGSKAFLLVFEREKK